MYVPILSARPSSRNSDPEHGARGENMSDDKIKIKDLGGNISQDPKDILRVARELGLPVKSATGSVTSEEATRLRDYFAEQKQVDAERAGSQRDVIVRRRRKDSPQEAETAAQETPVAASVETEAPKETAPVVEASCAQGFQARAGNGPRRRTQGPQRQACQGCLARSRHQPPQRSERTRGCGSSGSRRCGVCSCA